MTVVSLLGISIPVFVLGPDAPVHLRGPARLAARGGPDRPAREPRDAQSNFMLIDSLLMGRLDLFVDGISHLILPAIALGSIPLAIITRITRASVLDVANEDYVRTARAKGLSERGWTPPRDAQRVAAGRDGPRAPGGRAARPAR